MRSRHGGVVAGVALAIAFTVAGGAVANVPAKPDAKGQAVATASVAGSGSWFERSWQRIREVFGLGASGKARWTDAELSAPGGCGSYGCTCCHSSIMEVGKIPDGYVHPAPPAPAEEVNDLYLRAARAITKMNPTEREQLRRRIRGAIANRDTAGANRLIEGVVSPR